MVFPVRRNEYEPQFTQSLYQKDISESFPLGVMILQVLGVDRDEVWELVHYVNPFPAS